MLVRQAANVVELLEFFAERGQPATLAEIADSLGWPRSSTFNLVNTLVSKGYFYEPKTRGGYYPSLSWQRVATAVAAAEPLPEAVERLAQDIADVTGETACIAAPAGVSGLLIYAVESRKPVRFSPWLGERNPIHASASGRALLSQYSPAEREGIYRKIRFDQHRPNAPGSIAEVEASIRNGAARGYFVCDEEVMEDVVSVATPLPVNGRTLALVVAGPVFRCRTQTGSFGSLLHEAAGRLCSNGAARPRPRQRHATAEQPQAGGSAAALP